MILLDTHVWLWWRPNPEQLSERSRSLLTIGENQNTLPYSAAAASKSHLRNNALSSSIYTYIVYTIYVHTRGCYVKKHYFEC